jgi:hypothetical protein
MVVVVLLVLWASLIISRQKLNKEAYKPLPMGDGQKYLYDFKQVHFPNL